MAGLTIERSADRAAGRPDGRAGPSIAARAGMRIWRLFTSVNFAVVQIVAVAVLAVFGMTIRQLPGFAFRSAGDYAIEMGKLRSIYEPAVGVRVVDLMERLQLFQVFTSTPFTVALFVLAVSILICTLDRLPRLWQQSAAIRVVQPEAYFDRRLPDRVSIAPGPGLTPAAVVAALRRNRFVVREDVAGDVRFIYGDRNRWMKLSTLISHLGLILFLVAGLVTSRLGDEQGLVVAEGDTLTVQPIGTPGLLLVKNLGFEAPGLETGSPTDFTTDLAVYRDGVQLARKTIRVNDPLTVGGYTFHQNGFGPAPDIEIRSTEDGTVLWSGPVPFTDAAGGQPTGALPVPGRPYGLQFLLDRAANGVGALVIVPYAVRGTNPDGTPDIIFADFPFYATRGAPVDLGGLHLTLQIKGFSEYTLLIAKRDPGAPIIWGAFATLLLGLAITFYFPRRRVWARFGPDGRVDLVGRADRQVDFDRELGSLVDALVAARETG